MEHPEEYDAEKQGACHNEGHFEAGSEAQQDVVEAGRAVQQGIVETGRAKKLRQRSKARSRLWRSK